MQILHAAHFFNSVSEFKRSWTIHLFSMNTVAELHTHTYKIAI